MGKKYLKVLSGREDLPGIENVAVDLVQQLSNLLQAKQQEMLRNGTPPSQVNSIAAISAMALHAIYMTALETEVGVDAIAEECHDPDP